MSYVPAEALSLVAEVANRPIVISTETFLGRGAVGGFLVTPRGVGEDAARLALRILNGEEASRSPPVSAAPTNRYSIGVNCSDGASASWPCLRRVKSAFVN